MAKKKRRFSKALITGITGAGGSYLADYIVDNHPEVTVHGMARWHSTASDKNLDHCRDKIQIHECDLNDLSSVLWVMRDVKPDLIFHLASHANVLASYKTPLSVISNNVTITGNLLEAIRLSDIDPMIQLCSTSEVYGQVDPKNVPINEDCPLNPTSPYAVSKVAQDLLGFTYFRSYGMKVVRPRMFAYINPRREDLFASSFAMQIARIEAGQQKVLKHGNLDSVRTLIDVRDAMEAYWVLAEKGKPGEIYNMGGTNSVKVGEFLDMLISMASCDIPTEQDPALLRPADVTLQIPDTSKFEKETGWKPKYSFEDSVNHLLEHVRKAVNTG